MAHNGWTQPLQIRAPGRAGFGIVSAALAIGLGVGLGLLGSGVAGSRLTLAAVGLFAGGLLLAVGLWRLRTLAIIGFALLPIVRREPAPVDLAFATLVLAILLTAPAKIKVRPALAAAVAAFAGVTLLSIANASRLSRAASYEWTTLYLIALGICLSVIFADEDSTRGCIEVYVIGATASSILGVLALFGSYPGSHLMLYDPHRTMGLFKDPNVFSGFLVPAAAILVDEIADPQRLRWRFRTKVCCLTAVAGGLLFAFSRAAWLNAALAIALVITVHLIRNGGVRQAARLVLPMLAVGAAGYGLLAVTHSTGFLESRSHLQTYDQQRFATQSEALHDATRHLFGFGPGQVEVNLPLASHSLYARVAYEQGVPGLVALAAIFALTLWAALHLAARRTHTGVGGAALLGSWVGLIANSFFIDTLHWRHLWIIGGLIWTSYALSERGETAGVRMWGLMPVSPPSHKGDGLKGVGSASQPLSSGRRQRARSSLPASRLGR
jgi:O-antigen ligase/polysaccharide polymerase Wzy-like membrane protein